MHRFTLALLTAAALSACGSDSQPGDPTPPALTLSTTRVTVATKQDGDPVSRTFTVGSDGAPVAWTASTDAGWLTITPASGTTPSTVTVVANPLGLAPGRATGTITLNAPGQTSAKTVAIDFDVAALPTLSLTTNAIAFAGANAGSIPPQAVGIALSDPSVAWTASTTDAWIIVAPKTGTGSGSTAISVNPVGLGPGNYSGSVIVAAAGTKGSPRVVTVTLAVPTKFTVTVSASPAELGTVSGGGSYAAGDAAVVTATPNAGAEFVSWTDGRVVLATVPTYSFLVSRNQTLVANFRGPATAVVTTTPSPSSGGTVTGAGTYPGGTSITVTATPNPGYSFVSWTENGTVVSTSQSFTLTGDGPRDLVANFTNGSQPAVTISTSVNPSGAGVTTGNATITVGATHSVTAGANTGWAFSHWTENGAIIATTSPYTFSATTSRLLIANFVSTAASTVTILANTSPTNGGTVSGSGAYAIGATVTLTATAFTGYQFVRWTENGANISVSPTLTFTAAANRNLVAVFAASP